MSGHDKRLFSLAFGLVNSQIELKKKKMVAEEQGDDEMMIMDLQFTSL